MERIDALRESVDHLSEDGGRLREELAHLTEEMGRRTEEMARRTDVMARRTTVLTWLFGAGAIILACVVTATITVSLNNQAAIEKSNRQWCPMVALLIPQPGEARATTARGQQLEENARALYTTFGCGIAR